MFFPGLTSPVFIRLLPFGVLIHGHFKIIGVMKMHSFFGCRKERRIGRFIMPFDPIRDTLFKKNNILYHLSVSCVASKSGSHMGYCCIFIFDLSIHTSICPPVCLAYTNFFSLIMMKAESLLNLPKSAFETSQ